MQVSCWACGTCFQWASTFNVVGFAELHVAFLGTTIEQSNGLQSSHPRILMILAGAIALYGGNMTINGSEMRRDGLSGFEGKPGASRDFCPTSLGPFVPPRCVFSFLYTSRVHIYTYVYGPGLLVATVDSALTSNNKNQ